VSKAAYGRIASHAMATMSTMVLVTAVTKNPASTLSMALTSVERIVKESEAVRSF